MNNIYTWTHNIWILSLLNMYFFYRKADETLISFRLSYFSFYSMRNNFSLILLIFLLILFMTSLPVRNFPVSVNQRKVHSWKTLVQPLRRTFLLRFSLFHTLSKWYKYKRYIIISYTLDICLIWGIFVVCHTQFPVSHKPANFSDLPNLFSDTSQRMPSFLPTVNENYVFWLFISLYLTMIASSTKETLPYCR